MQKYERGSNRVSAGRLWKLAQVFDVPLSTFYEGMEELPGKRKSPLGIMAKRDPFKLIEAFDTIKQQPLRKVIVLLVKRIADATKA